MKKTFLNLFNLIWKIKYLLRFFVNLIVIPIYKGKNKLKNLSSYRLVALIYVYVNYVKDL